MATFTKVALSGDANGEGILVVAETDTDPHTTIHTTTSGTTFDEIWLYATNNDVSAVNLTIEFGNTTATLVIQQSIPSKTGLTVVVPGLVLDASKTVLAFAGSANKVVIFGYVNRIA